LNFVQKGSLRIIKMGKIAIESYSDFSANPQRAILKIVDEVEFPSSTSSFVIPETNETIGLESLGLSSAEMSRMVSS